MRRLVMAAALLFLGVSSTHTFPAVSDAVQADDRLTATIEAVDKELAQAFVKSDLAALDRMYADSYVFTDPMPA